MAGLSSVLCVRPTGTLVVRVLCVRATGPEYYIIAERISARQLIRVHISANTYVRT